MYIISDFDILVSCTYKMHDDERGIIQNVSEPGF